MTERLQRELEKLRLAPPMPADLWHRVEVGTRRDVRSVRIGRRAVTILVAVAIATVGLGALWTAIRPLHRGSVIPAGSGVLAVPPVGEVAAANLTDGRPVFVVHHEDGTVSVVDGFSTHVPWGLATLIAWCPSSRTFEDLFHGGRWNEDGAYMLGPPPSGLVTYQTTILADGRVQVGSEIAPAPRGTGDRGSEPPGPFCGSARTSLLPKLPTRAFTSPGALIDARLPGWVAVTGQLEATGPDTVELCSVLTVGPGCPDGAPVEGIDVPGLFGEHPRFAISGTFVARVQGGSLINLTRVPG